MEPQLSVLLYSKYSPMSKKLTAFMQGSQVDFTRAVSLQTLCVDNEQIRERIQKNEQLDITSVPCILVIFPDGGIEKYDGAHAFEWIEQIITKFAPPPPPQPVQPRRPQKMEEEKWREEKRRERELIEKEREQIKLDRESVREEQRRKYEEHIHRENPQESEGGGKHRRRRRIRRPPSDDEGDDGGHTRIEDLDSDEDQKTSDRHRDLKPIAAIREDSGNYTRDDDLFPGSPTDMRRPKRSAVKGLSKNASEQKGMDLMAKAKELAKGREESDPRPPPGHPRGKVM